MGLLAMQSILWSANTGRTASARRSYWAERETAMRGNFDWAEGFAFLQVYTALL